MDQRVRDPGQSSEKGPVDLSADLVGLGLTVQGVFCPAAVLAIWKLHGESKFGKQPQDEMRELRGRVLRSLASSLVDVFEPILTLESTVQISGLLQSDGNPISPEPKITTTGEETFRNAVRDFVKRDHGMLKSLRSLDTSDSCITHALIWLRRLTLALSLVSGVFLLLAVLSKFNIWPMESRWPHILGLITSGAIVCIVVAFLFRIMHSVNVFDGLKGKYADLP